jgi:hypothetical protein
MGIGRTASVQNSETVYIDLVLIKATTMDKARLKHKLLHELVEFLKVFLFLAPLFCAFSTYRMLVLNQFGDRYLAYGAAFFNAFILSKIILIGEHLKLGKRLEEKPLIYSTIYKSLAFTLLVAIFRILEGGVKGLVHGEGTARAFDIFANRSLGEVLARSFVMFCAFLPFFALRETGRVLGEGGLTRLFFGSRSVKSDPSHSR